ncbi:hypothetical protein PR202_gb06005 [Eleusine coracana subsp. coracana]|uniref:non-specific serine/threonine protein kinase n=1 Tax=Eleusine coracana subsp. coracana TaxID=191504 RepID=A0AAV5E8S2_ELECO|nr:hypothetical protein QOZ80_2BG0152720 [Eleusine coracana subsp. coracana]GJN18803.1 hypothetical protein PR202_gb06005 [Eleusine coracana subsp. coracana]
MGSRAAAILLVVSLIVLWRSEIGTARTAQRCGAGDLEALRGFSAGLDAAVDGWPVASDDCCAWPGVVCSNAEEVIGLVLPNRTLQGQVSASLAGLAALRVLNLSSNALRGPLPADLLLRLRRLEVLDVSGNALSGTVDELLLLPSSMRVFNVSNNAFAGGHPVLRSGGAANLTHYDASGNGFDGAVQAARLCQGESPSLRVLRLSMNRLSGDFPFGFGQCRSLVELALDGNNIGGALPDDLFSVTSLQILTVHTNSVSGGLSTRLRNLSSLVRLDLSFNAFTGKLPNVFDTLPALEEFSAPSNRFSGELPATLSRCRRLRVLNLRNNTLAGDIVNNLDFRKLSNLAYLDLGVNNLTGPIPASIPEYCKGMTALNLGRNRLTGEIPASFAGFSSLSFLSLTGNSFTNVTSALLTLQSLPNLTSLVLTKNFLGGQEMMPSSGIITGGFRSMEVLVIANCELRGTIPSWIAGLRKLRVLDISWNRLTGQIPPWIGEFDRLFYLDVSNNSLHGEIPGTLLARLPGLMNSDDSGVQEQEQAVQDFPFFMRRNTSVKGRQYNQVSSFPPSLVLGHNHLTGAVPKELGELTKVHIVDLSWNRLSGPIPTELSGMSSVETLDLSHNNLSGTVPASLTRLSFLSRFDVSHNNLSGQVPVGGQFSTFSRDDFEGNPFLCGIHVAPCTGHSKEPPEAVDTKRRNAGGVVAAAISVGTALLLAVVAAVTWRAWSRRRHEDNNNARVAADYDDEDLELMNKQNKSSTMVVLFPQIDDDDDQQQQESLTVEDVVKATGNFDESRIVGCGGFGMVYRATLPDGRDVAVKRLSGEFYQMEREFRAEVETLSRVRHANLVPLQGYCRRAGGNNNNNKAADRLLIYPFMENGSLDQWLHHHHESQSLPWPARLGIARGASRGLAHLHATSEPRVLHRDVKSSNILLDARMEPRLADFGLARLVACPTDTHVTTDLVGTLGYIPPEYGHSSVATYRGDVYSLGVVLLELVTGRRPVDMARPAGDGRDVTSWALRMWRQGRGHEVVDATSIVQADHKREAVRMLDVACACVNENPKSRPTAQQVVQWLDAIAASSSEHDRPNITGSM